MKTRQTSSPCIGRAFEIRFALPQTGWITLLFMLVAIVAFQVRPATAQEFGPGARPYMGWTTWTQQSYNYPAGDAFQNETNVDANSDAMLTSGLQAHGFRFINIDGDWDNGLMCQCGPPITFDAYGRPQANVTRFPHGMAAVAAHIHANGQKAGIYWEPGVPPQAYAANTPILGTPYTVQQIVQQPLATEFNGFYLIDFTKPGAQEYENSIVQLFAQWEFDYLKLDGVRVGSSRFGGYVDDRPDVRAISLAVLQSGRPMYFNLSSSLNHDYVGWWERWSNGRRIDGDIECDGCGGPYETTTWAKVAQRFTDLISWQNDAGYFLGWNDLDSLEVGNTTNVVYPQNTPEILEPSNPPSQPTSLAGAPALVDGLTNDQRQTMVTLWSIANAPLQLGDDLTLLDSFGIQLLTNDEVIAVDQSRTPGQVVTEGNTPVWAQTLCDGSYYVALFNLNTSTAAASVNWLNLGFSGPAYVRDLWAHSDLGVSTNSFSITLNPYGSSLLRVKPVNRSQRSSCERQE